MKFAATLLLAAAVIIPYYFLSNGTFYLPEDSLSKLSFSNDASLANYFTHLFTHVGLQHLMSNLVPLLLFGLLLEATVGFANVIIVFLLAGIVSSVIFTTFNPFVLLVGASTGVAGLMVSSTVLRPKKGLLLLILTFIFLLASQPLVAAYNDYQVQQLSAEKAALEENVQKLLSENKTQEAEAENKTLEKVESSLIQTTSGIEREAKTPTDLFVHLLGALVGGLYVFFFLRKELDRGLEEFEEIGEFIFEKLPSSLKNKNKG